jgi:hypothetical protein
MTQPKLSQQTKAGRIYRDPVTKERVPSVTTIISAGYPKPALVGWAAKMAAQYAVENWDSLGELSDPEKERKIKTAHIRSAGQASDLGTQVHKVCEYWQSGKPIPQDIASDPFMNGFIDFLIEKKPRFKFLEVTLWSQTHGYAGTADWIAEIDGKVTYGDIKTGKSLWPEVGMQLAALGHADYIIKPDGTREEMPAPEEYAALHLRPRTWKLVYLDHIEESFQAFLSCKNILNWTHGIAPDVLRKT